MDDSSMMSQLLPLLHVIHCCQLQHCYPQCLVAQRLLVLRQSNGDWMESNPIVIATVQAPVADNGGIRCDIHMHTEILVVRQNHITPILRGCSQLFFHFLVSPPTIMKNNVLPQRMWVKSPVAQHCCTVVMGIRPPPPLTPRHSS